MKLNKILPILYTVSCLFLFPFVSFASSLANEIEERFVQAGLIDIHAVDESIKVNLVNSDPDKNFFRENFYDGLNKAYLRREVAHKLSNAQKYLKSKFPEYSLLIMDAARPASVSKSMHNKVKGTRFERFVANPKGGSMHNYGIAIDVTILDDNGKEIDMGISPFYRSDLAIYWNYAKFRIFGLNNAQKENRKLLSDVMKKAGFTPLSFEWWHFNGMSKDTARKEFHIIK